MAHTAENIKIDGTTVKVAIGIQDNGGTGVSRTVNIYDQTNTEGNYREVYRLPESTGITASSILSAARTIGELDTYLIGLGAVKEGARRA